MNEQYDVYGAGAGAEDLPWELGGPGGPDGPDGPDGGREAEGITRAPAQGGWCVLVEFAARTDRPTTEVRVLDDGIATREKAEELAASHAFEFAPPDPWSLRSREVYEDTGGFLTILTGATSTFHFTTRVARFVGERKA